MTGILWATPLSDLELPLMYECYPSTPHVTLLFGVDRHSVESLIKCPVTVGVREECWDDTIQALKIVLPTWLPCQLPQPHLTLSWVNGTQAFNSNKMLAGEHNSKPAQIDHIGCVIEFEDWGEPEQKPALICPQCSSLNIWKRGRNRNGTQRCKCQNCGRSFTV